MTGSKDQRTTTVNGHTTDSTVDLEKAKLNVDTNGTMNTYVTPPNDRYNMVYLILMLHGVGVLMPWNMFITAHSYFSDYKLNVTTGDDVFDSRTRDFSKNFLSYIGVAAQVPNVVCNGLNLFVKTSGGSMTVRVTASIIIISLVFVTTVALALTDSSTWPHVFFYTTMTSVVILNCANGVYQNTVYGIAAKLPMRFSNAVVLGSNISGTITAIIAIVTIAISPSSPRTSAVYYFLTALFVLFLCLDTYFALPLCKYYKHFLTMEPTNCSGPQLNKRPPYFKVFREIWPQCLNVFFIFFVTLSLFPAVQANVKSTGSLGWLTDKYFSPVTCFLVFNSFAMIGNLFPNWITWPGPDKLWIPVFARFVFIPFFLFCNYNPATRTWPVYFGNDWFYVIGGMFLGLTSGYYSSLAMMYAPRTVADPDHAPIAGMMAAFFLILGIFLGVNFSLVLSSIIEMVIF